MTGRSRLTAEQEAEIIRLYGGGKLTAAQVSAKTGLSISQVRRVVSRAGIGRPKGQSPVMAGERAAIIEACTTGGKSRTAVMAATGRSHTTIGKILREEGLVVCPDEDHLLAAQAAGVAGISAGDLRVLARLGVVASIRHTAKGRLLYSRADCEKIAVARKARDEGSVPPAGGGP